MDPFLQASTRNYLNNVRGQLIINATYHQRRSRFSYIRIFHSRPILLSDISALSVLNN